MNDTGNITLDRLDERHPGLTPALAQSYVEAACVCLARHHQTPVIFSVNHAGNMLNRSADFLTPDERTKNANANEIDATEAGAYGLSLAAIESVTGMVAVRRAETRTGADWYIAPMGESFEDLESCVRTGGLRHQRWYRQRCKSPSAGKDRASLEGETAISPL